ncbi:MAG: TRAP transporter substrate-binding protein DctP [Deltaproteobacteria bacterium]|nr:TRAP transporter substrate-binding protein DctP [Deltaproteobacteria bacterium]
MAKLRKGFGCLGWKGTLAISMAVLLVLAMACKAPSLAAEQKVIKLRFSSSFMPPEPPNVQANHTFDLVEKKTKGRVKIERFMAGALGGPHEQLDLASSGAVDVISLHIDQFPQQLPLHQITNTEQRVSGEQGLRNVTALIRELPETKGLFEAEQERNNIKILHFHANGPTGVTARFEVSSSLAELKGKKVNVIAAFHREVFKELGWIPVNVQIPELYEALSRGVIDAIFMATAAVIPLKWYEPAKAHLVLGENTVISTPLAFNLDSWNRLPADVQKAFLDASWETARWSVDQNERFIRDTYGKLEQSGAKVIRISQRESEEFFTVLFRNSIRNWQDICSNAGVRKEAGIIQKYWDEMKWGKWKGQ